MLLWKFVPLDLVGDDRLGKEYDAVVNVYGVVLIIWNGERRSRGSVQFDDCEPRIVILVVSYDFVLWQNAIDGEQIQVLDEGHG